MSGIQTALTKIAEVELALKEIRQALAGVVLNAPKPTTPSTPPSDSNITWKEGQYGEYAYIADKGGTPNLSATLMAERLRKEGKPFTGKDGAQGYKLTEGEYTYTWKEGSNFLNRSKAK